MGLSASFISEYLISYMLNVLICSKYIDSHKTFLFDSSLLPENIPQLTQDETEEEQPHNDYKNTFEEKRHAVSCGVSYIKRKDWENGSFSLDPHARKFKRIDV